MNESLNEPLKEISESENLLETAVDLDTVLVHGSAGPEASFGAVAPVLVRSKTYRQPEFGVESPWKYGRGTNPTRVALETKIAAIEGEGDAAVFASGLAALTCFLLTLAPGDHVLFSREVYGGTYRLFNQVFDKFGLKFGFANFDSKEEVLGKITPNTKYLCVETPSNPSLHVVDLRLAQEIARESGVPLLIDGTFAPPVTTRAFDYGAETVLYSLSKYFSGHNDVIGGAIVTRNRELHTRLKFLQGAVGAVLSPDECYRVLQGVKSLHLRWERVSQTAQIIAEYLQNQSALKRVLYPGLPSHPQHLAAQAQMKNGYGGVVAFETHTHDMAILKRFVDTLTARRNIVYAESLASPETILAYPIHMSHRSVPPSDLATLGINAGFFRLSLGFENPADLQRDFERALKILA